LPKIFELTLNNPAYGGESIGRLPDGRAVFVPFTIPGETVRIRITEDKKKYARGELLEVLNPAPERVSPRCQHFGVCGGCHYQHIEYEHQLVIKRKILKDQLERIGRVADPIIEDMVPSPASYYYRNHVQFHLSEKTKPGFIRADHNGVLEIKECHLPQSPLNDVWPLVEIEPETDISSFGLRVGTDEDILLTLKSPQVFEQEFNLESLPISVVHLSHNLEQVLAGNEYIFIEVGGRQFRVSARSFFQVNTQLAERMVSTVEELLPAKTNILLELYAGVGMFSAFLAKRVGKLLAIETSQSACDDFDYNLDDYDNVELYQGRVEDVIPLLDVKPDVVLIDPPRSGIDKKVLEHIITMSPKLLIYISCDPATLARDSQILVQGGYEPRSFLPIDLFSQTFHIETISFWVK
jgi:23S rRNA (uracil1939-C5)-methyltransferase